MACFGFIQQHHWEQENIFDAEFTKTMNLTSARAREIRQAYDAHWQTLQAYHLNPVSPLEQQAFSYYHPMTKQVYSCLLPGEVVRACVDQMRLGNINPVHLPGIKNLIVDEYQDLNECDQEFVCRIADAGATLLVAGDDDQSIYAFRHAAPTGIQNFTITYPGASSHQLQHCFRCTPTVPRNGLSLIGVNPGRLPKTLQSLYASAQPPVQGSFHIWRFDTGIEEARAIAQSCRDLIASGLDPKEIIILVCNTRVQLPLLLQEMQTLIEKSVGTHTIITCCAVLPKYATKAHDCMNFKQLLY
jgi:DNA helicase-2/ATP-dependent DNA helicase PcrA